MDTGAETLVRTLVGAGVDVCFTNPGTSEMHFVGALDRVPEMRCILGLFEGVVTGAADGFYRMARRPAATLLHLAPGLGNGLANLHNARKARSGIVNIVGDHATYHTQYDSPLSGDIEGVARPMSRWVRTTSWGDYVATDAVEAVRVASQPPGDIATLILPADISWGPGGEVVAGMAPSPPRAVADAVVLAAAEALKRGGVAATLLLGGVALQGRSLEWAGRIAAATGCRLLGETHNARQERGAGRVAVSRVPVSQPLDGALAAFAETSEIVLAGAKAPIAFFAYPGKPSRLTPPSCSIRELARLDEDIEGALEALAVALGAQADTPPVQPRREAQGLPAGAITREGMGLVLAELLPDGAVIVDEAITSGRTFFEQLKGAAPHDWLSSMGASIGFALPCAVGAAVAAPDRKILTLTGDGSAMYTLQALWTMARENLDVTVVVFANRTYEILRGEFATMSAGTPGPRAESILTIGQPDLDWSALARGHGVQCGVARDLTEFASELKRGFATNGPYVVVAQM